MGIDYVPFRLRDGVSEDELGDAIVKQSVAFRSMPFYWYIGQQKMPEEVNELLCGLHKPAFLSACDEISNKIDKLPRSYRTAVIYQCTALPPSVRFDGMSTILPSELPDFIRVWETSLQLVLDAKWQFGSYSNDKIKWLQKFLVWAKKQQSEGLGLYLCA